MINGIEVLLNESLKKHSTFKIGGNVDYLAYPKNISELRSIISYVKQNDISYFVLGNGSNVLFTDSGFKGMCIKLTKMNEIKIEGNKILADCGASLAKIAQICKDNELKGFEGLSYVPATIGGAVYMNAGAYGTEICDILVRSWFLNQAGEIVEVSNKEHDFSYRHSFYMNHPEYIVVLAEIELKKGDKAEIEQKMEQFRQSRAEKQPLDFPSCGSTFKRPPNNFAGKLIEDSGLKGYSIGGAKISEKHAGFVVNFNNATCKDVLDVIKYAKKMVFDKFDVNLECEIRVIGD